VSFTDCYSDPKPAQRDGIPIVIGGHSRPAARRAGRLGDGFFPGRGTAEELTPLIEEMRSAATDSGRDPDAIEITAMGPLDVEGIRRFADIGVDRLAIPPLGFDLASLTTGLRGFSDSVIAKF
jgi:alkanesulfonate monooxygenase SsuD/methylene tetrahydromethanopterin reductase-like flavin-dependent oxidoreductase (luciferase family)